ncbi:hypothetical protein [Thalassotalea sp. PS06]|uniref:hypothetical protein n=1 Tax=Thalassotalea sp. PS06 TaxID=2594005 RepID=UPI001165C81C|nr:hypothetical protein [Thalassotalea sp. PS06]QDP01558.1 hypothetical protein FNC98_09555 [Thalassotalea sp. PS06]
MPISDRKKFINALIQVIKESQESLKRRDFDNIAPSILLSEILEPEDEKIMLRDNELRTLMVFVEHYFDAITHNFDSVTDNITISEAQKHLEHIKKQLEIGSLDIPVELMEFERL